MPGIFSLNSKPVSEIVREDEITRHRLLSAELTLSIDLAETLYHHMNLETVNQEYAEKIVNRLWQSLEQAEQDYKLIKNQLNDNASRITERYLESLEERMVLAVSAAQSIRNQFQEDPEQKTFILEQLVILHDQLKLAETVDHYGIKMVLKVEIENTLMP